MKTKTNSKNTVKNTATKTVKTAVNEKNNVNMFGDPITKTEETAVNENTESTGFESLDNIVEVGKTKKEKVKKEPKEKKPSVYGPAHKYLCANPNATFEKYAEDVKKETGLSDAASERTLRTVYWHVTTIIAGLRENGFMKK